MSTCAPAAQFPTRGHLPRTQLQRPPVEIPFRFLHLSTCNRPPLLSPSTIRDNSPSLRFHLISPRAPPSARLRKPSSGRKKISSCRPVFTRHSREPRPHFRIRLPAS